jgi:Tat protein translocase TatB subunit
MIDIAWSQFLFIAIIALIFIGPKELPTVLRNIGRWVGRARAFAKDISEQLDLYSHINDSDPAQKEETTDSPPEEPTMDNKIRNTEIKSGETTKP